MRKIILSVAVSLDGFIEGPKGEYDWCLTDQDYGISDFFKGIDTLFMGRKTYQLAQTMGDMPGFPKFREYVFSNTLGTVRAGSSIVKGDIKTEVDKIRSQPGKNIWLFGGASLSTTLMNLGLVNELLLAVHPVVLGGGTPLFSKIEQRTPLQLMNTKTWSTGLVSLTYTINNKKN